AGLAALEAQDERGGGGQGTHVGRVRGDGERQHHLAPRVGHRAVERPGRTRPLTQEAQLARHVPRPARHLVVLGAYDRHVTIAARRPWLSARQDGHGVAARAERLDQDARLLLDAPDLAVARAEEGDPHRSPLSALAAPVPGAVQSSAWRLYIPKRTKMSHYPKS